MKSKLLIALAILFSFATRAQVVFKNDGPNKIYVAIGYFKPASGWTSQGWFPIEPNEEKVVFNHIGLSNPNFYYCATIEGCDKGFFGESELYVNAKDPFTIPNAEVVKNYANPLLKRYKFRQVNLSGKSKYVVTLNTYNTVCYGKPQGKWLILLDKEGEDVQKNEDAVSHREVTFDKGVPIGWCKDFYPDGKVKAEFKLLSYSPLVYDGKCTWYKPNGSLEREVVYRVGSPISATTYLENGQKVVSNARYEIVKLPVQSFYINSTSNETWKGGKSKTVFPVNLPKGTVEWYYEFTASRDAGQVQQNVKNFGLASQLATILDQSGILSASVDMLTSPPGGDLCNIYLMDQKYYNSFLSDGQIRHYPIGSRLNYRSGVVQIRDISIDGPIIGIRNPDMVYGINVSIQVIAIISKI